MKHRKKDDILKAGVRLWEKDHSNVTVSKVAAELGISHSLVLYHFPEGFKEAVKQYAFDHKNVKVIAQLIVTGDRLAEGLCPTERMKYLKKAVEDL